MCSYAITVVISAATPMLDAGQWQMCMAWKKRIVLQEAERGSVIRLRDLLNSGRQPYAGANATHNRTMWQWEYAASHSSQLLELMGDAGIDWPSPDGIPDISWPSITVNLALD